jgi:hypothetical protein
MPHLPAHVSARAFGGLGIGMLALSVMLFAGAMCSQLIVDEEQYIAAAHFARTLAPYRDFISFQPPVYTHVLALALELAPAWTLLAARLLTWALGVGCCVLLLSLLLSFGAGAGAAFAIVLAFVSSPFLDEPLVLARNDIMPLFFLLLGLRLCLSAPRTWSGNGMRLTAGGTFLALAAATKYTYAFAVAVMTAALLWEWRAACASGRPPPSIAAFLAGCLLGASPVLYALVTAFDNFVFSTVLFHRLAPLQYWRDHERAWELEFAHRLRMLARNLLTAGNLTLLAIGTLAAVTLVIRQPRKGTGLAAHRPVLLAALLAGALVFAFLPNPSFALYFPAVAALGALLAGELCARAVQGIAPRLLAVLLIVSLLPCANSLRWSARMVVRSIDPARWAGVQTHRLAQQVAQRISASGASGPVATLFPVNVMDANAVLPEFASGSWFFRSAHLFDARRIEQLHGASPASLDQLFARTPPAAIVGGFHYATYLPESPIDAPLLDYARRHGYEVVEEGLAAAGYRDGQLWVRPSSGQASGSRER